MSVLVSELLINPTFCSSFFSVYNKQMSIIIIINIIAIIKQFCSIHLEANKNAPGVGPSLWVNICLSLQCSALHAPFE